MRTRFPVAVIPIHDRIVTGNNELFNLNGAFWIGATGAMLGMMGGATAGAVCAAIVSAANRRRRASRQLYRTVAASVTAALAAPFGLTTPGSSVTQPDYWLVGVLPLAACCATAYLLGGWVWDRRRAALAP